MEGPCPDKLYVAELAQFQRFVVGLGPAHGPVGGEQQQAVALHVLHSLGVAGQVEVPQVEAARNRMELIVRSLAEQNGVTEQLKADNQMEWVRQMNACKAQAEEIVKAELIYD